jgi:hydrogenase nickel incorporation protein HypB
MTTADLLGAMHSVRNVKVVKSLLANNDVVAETNLAAFNATGVLAINMIASPGAGKTSTITQLIKALEGRARIAVIEGDIAGSIDTEKVLAAGAIDAVQINTGGGCHLEASMIQQALDDLDLTQAEILIIENVGNLICPNYWKLGEHIRLCLASTAEGHDKPLKYPDVFTAADVIVVNKTDLSELVDFDRRIFVELVRALNEHAPLFEISCRTGAGVGELADWLEGQREAVLRTKNYEPRTKNQEPRAENEELRTSL